MLENRASAPLSIASGNGEEGLSPLETLVLAVLRAVEGAMTRVALRAAARRRAADVLTAVTALIARGLVIRAGSGRSRDPFRFRAADGLSRIGRV